MARLDAMVKAMNTNGALAGFNRQYKMNRDAAKAAGRGYMKYSIAIGRLRLLLIPMMAAGRPLTFSYEQMRRSGQLAEFNARYKRGRAAARADGRGFMAYGIALKRLKVALIPHLMAQSGRPMTSIFEAVFR